MIADIVKRAQDKKYLNAVDSAGNYVYRPGEYEASKITGQGGSTIIGGMVVPIAPDEAETSIFSTSELFSKKNILIGSIAIGAIGISLFIYFKFKK